jgi:hypothetical protein
MYKEKFNGREESKQKKGRRGRGRERKGYKEKKKKVPCMAAHLRKADSSPPQARRRCYF